MSSALFVRVLGLVLASSLTATTVSRADPAVPAAPNGSSVASDQQAAASGQASSASQPSALAASAAPEASAREDQLGMPVGAAPTLAALQQKHNDVLYRGVLAFRSKLAPKQEWIAGDNTDPWGMNWTKCTNLGIHLLSTLVAEQRGLVSAADAKQQIRGIVDILGRLRTHRGIFPENIKIKGGIAAEVVNGRTRYSSIDSAWVTVALSLAKERYQSEDPALARAAERLLARQDYRVFVGADGLLGAGFYVDVATDKKVATIAFSYDDRNSEARPLVLALIGMGLLPASVWDAMSYQWGEREGLPLARGWHFSAFVELTGALFFDEAALAPRSLGSSHQNYLEATVRVAQRLGHSVFGYAPACDANNPYAEFGLDRPDAVSPYASALLTMTGDPRALANFDRLLDSLPRDGSPLADGIDPKSGQVSCPVARILDQGLMFLALNADVLRGFVQRAPWYAAAESRLKAMDQELPVARAPSAPPQAAPEAPPTAVPAAPAVPASAIPASVVLTEGPDAAISSEVAPESTVGPGTQTETGTAPPSSTPAPGSRSR